MSGIMARKFIDAAAATDPGNVRQYNEDCIAMDPELGVVVVADGMGGHRAGELASAMAAQIVLTGLRRPLPGRRPTPRPHPPLRAAEKGKTGAIGAIGGPARPPAGQLA